MSKVLGTALAVLALAGSGLATAQDLKVTMSFGDRSFLGAVIRESHP